MTSKTKRIMHKLYLTALMLTLIPGSALSTYYVIATVHDNKVTAQDLACYEKSSLTKSRTEVRPKYTPSAVAPINPLTNLPYREVDPNLYVDVNESQLKDCNLIINHESFWSTRAWVGGGEHMYYFTRSLDAFALTGLGLLTVAFTLMIGRRWLVWLIT